MKSLTTFYSRTGTTRTVADAISGLLGSDTEEVKTVKDRKGVIGYMICGREAGAKKLTDIEKTGKDPSKYDLVIVGTPIWAWKLSSPIRTYLTNNKGKFKKVAFFVTQGGSGAENAFKDIEEITGKKPVATLILTTKEVVKKQYAEKVKKFVEKIKK